jgi:hypothetical protein
MPKKLPKTPKIDLLSIMPLLPLLSQRDLTLVRAAADRLLNASAAPPGALYDALLTVVGATLPFTRFQKSAAYKNWSENERQLQAFINTFGTMNKVTERSLMLYLLDMLKVDLMTRKIPISIGTLAMNVGSIPAVFDLNFPGYREAGLAKMVLKSMVHR